ncbi:hypothetical protein [Halopiger djelfimassiliensis]|uniref:hypothetical protein n=1 Tax=Halopiger djelfimassiliensis TaxID=1293047 RepID=UPI0006781D82|nr:hypothetical protein [Halopiger djelfimassiliensis]
MTDSDRIGNDGVSRRTLLRTSGSALAVPAVGNVGATGRADRADVGSPPGCPEATLRPSMGHCAGTSSEGCADDHPATVELRAAVQEVLETDYPNVGTLIDAGFKPYFDSFDVTEEDGWSHWLHPDHIGDDAVLDPERPEAVLVDDDSWRSIGVMFVATRQGEPVEPPAVYDERTRSDRQREPRPDDHPDRCAPWHYHAGLPSRFAWWYYRQVYEREFEEGDLEYPCRTPCMMHVWTVEHPDSVYAHDAPPAASRDQRPPDEPGFETDARPGEDALGWDVLPETLTPERRPDEFPVRERLQR